ncbi:hypothetical protein IVA94_22365 [Bradyrhizobium sp. 156]|uniref:hypothetical protein n=1 Tax=Bradyrhizobium sp. 156 TaxID=2782630 RepID=UPI001FFB3954|nr:hypothetical protein [Bradyrhizobium sp. 156]MCK1323591.1 hypothetical protein [Bradyrhizobium sp. 156]
MDRNLLSKWIRPLAVGFIAWNALGSFACLQQIAISMGRASLTDPFQQKLYGQIPLTYDCLFVAAETSGLVGAILLLLRRSAARVWLGASLIFIVLQFGYLFATTDLLSHEGLKAIFFPLFVIAMGVIQLWAAACVDLRPHAERPSTREVLR